MTSLPTPRSPDSAPAIATRLRSLAPFFWVFIDQALFSIANFIFNVLLARWLPAEDYGSFSLAHSIYFALATLHGGFILEPLTVFGADRKRHPSFSHYLGTVLLTSIPICVALSLLLGSIALLPTSEPGSIQAQVFLAFAVSAPGLATHQALRRACYVNDRTRLAALIGPIYFLATILGAAVLAGSNLLSAPLAPLVLGGSSVITSLTLIRGLRPAFPRALAFDGGLKAIVRGHWDLGRWMTGSLLIRASQEPLFVLALTYGASIAAVGEFRAVSNLVLPFLLLSTALRPLFVSRIVRACASGDPGGAVRRLMLTVILCAGAYWLGIFALGEYGLSLLYGPSYAQHFDVLFALGAMPVLVGSASVLGAALDSTGHSRLNFAGSVAGLSLGAVLALPLCMLWGALGLAIVTALAQSVDLALRWVFWRRSLPGDESVEPAIDPGEPTSKSNHRAQPHVLARAGGVEVMPK